MSSTAAWNTTRHTISGSSFYEIAQPWMKDYVYNAEWGILYKKVWLDKEVGIRAMGPARRRRLGRDRSRG